MFSRSMVAVVVLLGTVSIQAKGIGDDYLTNGNFETGNFSGWSVFGTGSTNGFAAHNGSFGAQFANTGTGAGDIISQNIATENFATYQLSFWLRADGATATPYAMQILWDGFIAFAQTNPVAGSFVFYQINGFLGGNGFGNSVPLDFDFQANNGSWSIDDIRFVMTSRPAAIPESGYLLGMLALASASLFIARKILRVTSG